MALSAKQEAEILRLYHAEKWPVGTISSQLKVHHDAVERVLSEDGLPKPERAPRPSIADKYLPFIKSVLKNYPKICASRIHAMVVERGYPGKGDHFRAIVRRIRPSKTPEAYLRRRTLPGEECQVDWGAFGTITIGKAIRKLAAFVMVLSWCRAIFLRFFVDMRMENFLRGHQEAFQHFEVVPRVALYDNLKSVVLERKGDAIRYHPTFLKFSGHYRFEPRPVAVARGNEKGRVERAIRFVRTSFFAARTYKGLADLNRQADKWCEGLASDRRCPEDDALTVGEALEHERKYLLPLPDNPFPTDEREETRVRKQPYIRFDKNDYSVPFKLVRQTVVVLASPDTVRILHGNEVVASHHRSYSKGEQIEKEAHIKELVEHKANARRERAVDQLHHAAPHSGELLNRVAERGGGLGGTTTSLLGLLDTYGAEKLDKAIVEALEKETPHPNSVRMILERWRHEEGRSVPIPVELPDDPRVRNLAVRPHSLATYDAIEKGDEE